MNTSAAADTDPVADAQWAAATRSAIAEADAALAARFDAKGDIDRLLAARAQKVDAVVREAWSHCLPQDAALSLFAVGGYGRGELFPQSDIDLLVLGEADAQAASADALARFFTLLWDAGLPVGHAVRSAGECTRAALEDVTVLTALLEARMLAADLEAAAQLSAAITPQLIWPARDYFLAKREEQRARHARFGDTADNLEPNLKEGPGGLRDLQTLRWIALRTVGTSDFESLVALGQMGSVELQSLESERRALSRLRFGLHLVAGKREERLRFDYQKLLAARLGYVDHDDSLAVEQMMQVFYRGAGRVLRIGDRLLQRFEEQIEGEAQPEPLDEMFELRRGYLAARDPAWPRDVPALFAGFAMWASRDDIRGLHSQTARSLAESLPRIRAYGDAPVETRRAFLRLLRGRTPVRTLSRMARLGVLGRWIPAFLQVTGRMQFDLFHVFTVDQHTLAVLGNLESFASGRPEERFSLAHEVWPRLRKPELLLLAGLFHDIGKGRGGDHSELGAVDAREFCTTLGLSEGEVALVEWLVRHHLLMSTTAQKQDIADPDVIHRFARLVADRERLDNLYLLTCADIAGTSPKLWNAWKDRLLADLYTATRLALRRGLENPVRADERIAETRNEARETLTAFGSTDAEVSALFARMPLAGFERSRPDQIAWQAASLREVAPGEGCVRARPVNGDAGALEVFVHSPDRDGLFAAIVATLDRLGLAIQQARVLDGPHEMVFDSFEVVPVDARQMPAAADVEHCLSQALAGSLDSIRPTRRTQPRHLRHFRIAVQIDFGDVIARDSSGGSVGRTVLSLVCNDRPGLLADVAQVLRQQGLRVHDARIATFGERAEDVFQITDQRNQPLDETQQQALREALRACLDGEKQ